MSSSLKDSSKLIENNKARIYTTPRINNSINTNDKSVTTNIDELCLKYPEGAALVPFSSMLSTINNWRRECHPPQPKSLQEYASFLNMKKWENLMSRNKSKLTIQYINSADGSHAIVYADKAFLKSINTNHIFVDATYQIIPKIPKEIYQFLTVMALVEDNALPVAWVLMTNKTMISYKDVFEYFATNLAPHFYYTNFCD
ncbi:uncharacterized protein LOC123267871 [Cotesia glomerata]|uniref:uncharacterized protein LOC123267871 n=1 Tax=Cotesia glomerata TaxID=32391 RepID=UPI001D00E6AB|nr:uncharacterized protein LOC123267871 [Cotesia glomerata]